MNHSYHQQQQARQNQRLAKVQTARALVKAANGQMEAIGKNLLQSGQARSIEEAVRLACNRFGQGIAKELENNLRKLGADFIRITCP
jgi:hypothetical protein